MTMNNNFPRLFPAGVGTTINVNRDGATVSAQISAMGPIDISTDNFKLANGVYMFNIKNDSEIPVVLSVQLAGMPEGEFVSTTFYPGWNPEIVKAVQQDGTVTTDLKWGL